MRGSLLHLPAMLLAMLPAAGCDKSFAAGPMPATGAYGGHCDAPFAMPARVAWNHVVKSTYARSLGAPNHRIRDLILAPGERGVKLRGRFTYGAVDKDLADEKVEVWAQLCPGWAKW